MKITDSQQSMELGELYRELRIARGLKLKDVVRGNLSMSQLSRFENGQTMLSADRLLLAIEGIHMNFSEFGYALNNYELPDFMQMTVKMTILFSKQDIDGLKQLLADYEGYEGFDTYNRLNQLVIKDSIYSLDSSYEISQEDIDFLVRYLYDIEEWTEYELVIFGNTLTLLPDDDLIFLGKALVERTKLYGSLPVHNFAAKGTILNMISVLTDRKKFYHAHYFIDILEELLGFQDVFYTASLTFLRLLIGYQQGEAENLQKMEAHIAVLDAMGSHQLAAIFSNKLEECRPPSEDSFDQD